jgi:isopentenyldiphosphate isomerase
MENVKIFDEHMTPIEPFNASMDQVHKEGIWHSTFACWVVKKHPTKPAVLLQLRGPKNRIDPNTFDISSAGHLAHTEEPVDGLRELHEELGIEKNESDVIYMGVRRNFSGFPGYINREFCHTFMTSTTLDLEELKPEPGEVNGIFELNLEDGKNLFSDRGESIEIRGIVSQDGQLVPATRTVKKTDFCSYNDRCVVSKYYLGIMIMAEQFNNGDTRISV